MKLPAELIVFFTGMAPLLDIKLAIPLGLKLGLSPVSTVFFAMTGNVLLAALILNLLPKITTYAKAKSPKINLILEKIYAKTRKEHSKNFEKYEGLFLIMLVAIPLPGSGSGTASVIAFLFAMEYWKALTYIITGTLFGSILIMTGVSSITAIFHLLS